MLAAMIAKISTLLGFLTAVSPLACSSAHSAGTGASSSTSSGSATGGATGTGGASTSSSSSVGATGGAATSSASATSSSSGGPPPAGAPYILYTDVIAGPTTGGENGDGAYLSIFGVNFGSSGLGTTVKVTIGGAEVASYRTLGASLGRADVEQITVQVGALGSPTQGTALPVVVTVNGTASNVDQTFTPNPGRMLFVDNVTGDDTTAVPGDIAHPFQHVQLPSSKGAVGVAKPGDTIVLRGKGTAYTDLGSSNQFVRVIDYGGSAPTGASGTGPLAFIGYPGETVNIVNGTGGLSDGAAFSSFDHTQSGHTGGDWVTIGDLHIEGDGTAGVIAIQIQCDHWRIVNNELESPNTNGAMVLAGGVNGNGTNISILGNAIHDITGSGGVDHGVYIDGDGSYDVAYNLIYKVASGYGIQAYNDAGNSPTTSHVHVHHNLVHDVTGKGCLNVADGAATDFQLWENVCYNINLSCLRLNDTGTLAGAQIFNNTFYNCGMGDTFDGAIDSDGDAITTSSASIVNNIVWPASGVPYTGGSGNGFATGVFVKNLWNGATSAPTGSGNVSKDPRVRLGALEPGARRGEPGEGRGVELGVEPGDDQLRFRGVERAVRHRRVLIPGASAAGAPARARHGL